MNITIITIGSQGDIVPFLALAKGLQQKGHSVRIAALSRFKNYVEQNGISYMPLTGDADELIRLLIGVGVGPLQYFRSMDRMAHQHIDQLMEDILQACQNADAVVYSVLGSVAWHVAEKLGIPALRAFPCPLDPTSDFPTMTAPELPLGRWYNRLTYQSGDRLWGWITSRHLTTWRKENGLPPLAPLSFPYRQLNGKPVQTLYPFSPTLVPRPTGWGDQYHLTGFWFLDESSAWQPEEGLLRFLENGTPPVYIGFGSMLGGSFQSALEIIQQALKITGQRAILSSGWGKLTQADLTANIYKIDYVPHDWLFPRVEAVIHHGGAGTTAAGLKAGCPSLIIPFGGDQPFWGKRIHAVGAGPQPIHRKNLTIRNLSAALDELFHQPAWKTGAQAMARAIQQEDGVGNAIKVIEQIVHSSTMK